MTAGAERRWIVREADVGSLSDLVSPLADLPPISPLLARLLLNRGVDSREKARAFLQPTLRTGLRSPLLFPDMEKAAGRIVRARAERQPVCIYGDYDVDGVTGSAQLYLFLHEIGMAPEVYIPHRTREGYGLHSHVVRGLAERGVRVLITADCGAANHEEIELAQRLGIDVIVCDHHHVADRELPAFAVLNPMQPACPFSFAGLAAAGVVFYLLLGIRMHLRALGERTLPDVRQYLDLVCLGTVADLVPLVEENRVLVVHGLRRIAQAYRPGIAALKAVSGEGEVSSRYVGFRLGPRINASGRLAEARLAFDLLTTPDPALARRLAQRLDDENLARRTIEQSVLEQAVQMIEAQTDWSSRSSFVLASEAWHPGVIGIVASRLVERFHRPTILIATNGKTGKGSGRSPSPFHLYEGLKCCAHLLDGFGGHRQAAGLSMQTGRISELAELFELVARERIPARDRVATIEIDDEVDLDQLGGHVLDDIQRLEPYGQGNPEPVFMARAAEVQACRVVGGGGPGAAKPGHLKLVLRSARGGRPVDAIGFGMGGVQVPQGSRIDVLYTPALNTWHGGSHLQLRIRDLREHDAAK